MLRFGEFKTKAGRLSPYFFNAGLFDDGAKLGRLAEFYARRLLACGHARSTCCSARPTRASRWPPRWRSSWRGCGRNVPFAYNRKEAKDHGEGGTLVGAPVARPRADRRRRDLGRHLGARVDRDDPGRRRHALRRGDRARPPGEGDAPTEGGRDAASAVQYVTRELGLQVAAIATLDDLLQYLCIARRTRRWLHTAGAVAAYRERYGVVNEQHAASVGSIAAMPPRLAPVAACAARAAGTAGAGRAAAIYTCIDAKGKQLTSDRPIAECIDREQQLLNRDGSLRSVMPAHADRRRARRARGARAPQAWPSAPPRSDAIRRDRNLMARYPNEAAHQQGARGGARRRAQGDASRPRSA